MILVPMEYQSSFAKDLNLLFVDNLCNFEFLMFQIMMKVLS